MCHMLFNQLHTFILEGIAGTMKTSVKNFYIFSEKQMFKLLRSSFRG